MSLATKKKSEQANVDEIFSLKENASKERLVRSIEF